MRLLSQRGVSEAKARQIERSHDLAEVLKACAAFDAGELTSAGGVVNAITEGWQLKAEPILSSRTPANMRSDMQDKAMSWRETLDQDARRRVLEMVRKSYQNMQTIDDDTDDPKAWATAHQLHRALAWWNGIGDDERAAWREVVRTAKPDMKGIDDDRPHAVGAAHRIAHGMAKLSRTRTETLQSLTW